MSVFVLEHKSDIESKCNKFKGASTTTNEPTNDVAVLNVGLQTKHLKPSSKHQDVNDDNEYIVEESIRQTTETAEIKEDNEPPNKFADFTDELVFPAFSKEGSFTLLPNSTKPTNEDESETSEESTTSESVSYNTTEAATISFMSYEAPQYEDLSEENMVDNNEEYLITLTTKKTTPEMTSTTTTTTTISTTTAITKTAHTKESSSSEKDIDLCNDPEIDDITRTEWGNAFIFKGFKFNFRLLILI